MNNLTFEALPKAVKNLTNEVSELKRLFLEQTKQKSKDETEILLNVEEASVFLKLAVPTIYSKVSKGQLPVMKRSKRLYFSSVELMKYLKEGRKKTNMEIEEEAEAHLLNLKKGLK